MNGKHRGYRGVNVNAYVIGGGNKDGDEDFEMQGGRDPIFFRTCFRCTVQSSLGLLHLIVAGVSFVFIITEGIDNAPVYAWWGKASWGQDKCATHYNDATICPYQGDSLPNGYRIYFSVLLLCSQFITAMSHFVRGNAAKFEWVTTLGQYQQQHGVKSICWIEYVFTAAMTSHLVLHLGGMWDIRTQLIAYASQALLMVAGFSQDMMRAISLSTTDESLRSACTFGISFVFVIGAFGLMTIWIWPWLTLWFGTNLGEDDDNAPSWVKYLVLGEFFLYASFGIVQFVCFLPLLSRRSQQPEWWFHWEQVSFDILSVLSKFLLNLAFCHCFVFGACGS